MEATMDSVYVDCELKDNTVKLLEIRQMFQKAPQIHQSCQEKSHFGDLRPGKTI